MTTTTAAPTKRCPTCHGSGVVPDELAPCQGRIVVGGESVDCWADRRHPIGIPHMALVSRPCYACGGYEEHHESCAVYPAEPDDDGADTAAAWHDGDLALRLAGWPEWDSFVIGYRNRRPAMGAPTP